MATIEQSLAVRRPRYFEQRMTGSRQLMIIVLCVALAVLYNLSGFWEMQLDNKTGSVVPLLRAKLWYVWLKVTISDIAVCYVLPLLLLTIFNWLVYKQMARKRKFQFRMSTKRKCINHSSRMLIFIVLMFILCYTLSLVLLLWELVRPDWFMNNPRVGGAISDLSNMLTVLNAASTFLFYLRFSLRYRRTVAQLFCVRDHVPQFSVLSSTTLEKPTPDVERRAARRVKGDTTILRASSVSWNDLFKTRHSSTPNGVVAIHPTTLSLPIYSAILTSRSHSHMGVEELGGYEAEQAGLWMSDGKPLVDNRIEAMELNTRGSNPSAHHHKCRRSLSSSAIGQIKILRPDGVIVKCSEDTDMMVDPEIITLV